MFRGTELGKNLGVRQIISIAVIAVCLITLLTPWLYIGMKTTQGDSLDINDIFDDLADYIDYLNDLDIEDLIDEGASPKEARKEVKTVQRTVTKTVKAIRDSKLTPVETASVCTNIASFLTVVNKYEEVNFGNATGALFFAGAVLWLLILVFAVLGIRCVWTELSGKKAPLAGTLSIYLVLFLLHIILTIFVNHMMKKEMEDSLGTAITYGLLSVENPSVFHIRFAPILGSILLIGNLIIEKKGIFGETSGSVGVGMEAIGKKVIWKCSCGSVNPSGNRFCAKCGKARPADSAPLDFKTDVMGKVTWTCTCGNINPKKNAFCSKCGAMRPTDTVSAACCKMCGKPVTDGAELCRECLLKMSDTSRIRRPAPPERRAAETIAEKKAGTPADESRVRKTFRPPTSLD